MNMKGMQLVMFIVFAPQFHSTCSSPQLLGSQTHIICINNWSLLLGKKISSAQTQAVCKRSTSTLTYIKSV